ncbi:OprD family porin [Zestomonas carbonaria]|uniref:Porin-like protein NicP n=1 Tax=Zestomonas carbonaria TaxID=2762745 RepID=A0A7U7EQD2_9GAMM|nr:OprD family porin [Pseudomonas carbonaria]CAD5109155.1 Porin-like protein NicP [Pseudomonas carbonaria]
MYNNKNNALALTAVLLGGWTSFGLAGEGFLEGSSASLQLRNFYMNRDYRDGDGVSRNEEWAQGFQLDYRSGYTQGTLGLGVDLGGRLGLKLDSGAGRSGTGLLPTGDSGHPADDYSRLDPTLKARLARSEFRLGALVPRLPTLQPNQSRLFPQTFHGGLLSSQELDGLTFTLARLDDVSQRNEGGRSDLELFNRNKRFTSGLRAGHLDLVGLDWQARPGWTLSYHLGELEDVYRQHFLGLRGQIPVGEDRLELDLRLFDSSDAGTGWARRIDNRALGGLFTYRRHDGHALGLGLQRMNGDSAFPYVQGADAYLVNFGQYNDFAERGERSWQLRYDYDFVALGVPGLSLMARYFKGWDGRLGGGQAVDEWERDTDIRYVVQSGPLKNLGLTWRNAVYRTSEGRDVDENRLILSYSLPLF